MVKKILENLIRKQTMVFFFVTLNLVMLIGFIIKDS